MGRFIVAALPRGARVTDMVRLIVGLASVHYETGHCGRTSDWRCGKTDQQQKNAEGAPVHDSLLVPLCDSMAMWQRDAIGVQCTIKVGAILPTARASPINLIHLANTIIGLRYCRV